MSTHEIFRQKSTGNLAINVDDELLVIYPERSRKTKYQNERADYYMALLISRARSSIRRSRFGTMNMHYRFMYMYKISKTCHLTGKSICYCSTNLAAISGRIT